MKLSNEIITKKVSLLLTMIQTKIYKTNKFRNKTHLINTLNKICLNKMNIYIQNKTLKSTSLRMIHLKQSLIYKIRQFNKKMNNSLIYTSHVRN